MEKYQRSTPYIIVTLLLYCIVKTNEYISIIYDVQSLQFYV